MTDESLRRLFGGAMIYAATAVRLIYQYRTRRRSMETLRHLPVARGAATVSSWSWFALLTFAPIAQWVPVDDLPIPLAWRGPVAVLGALVLAGSVALFLACHVALGEFWHGEPGLKIDHELVMLGPYRWIRHPMYTSFFAGYLGALLLLQSWVFVIPILFAPGFFVMAHVEEGILGRRFEVGYAAYRRRAGRFLPRIPSLLRGGLPRTGV